MTSSPLTYTQKRKRPQSLQIAAGQATKHATVFGIKVPVLCSQQEVADYMGISQMAVSYLERSALKKLKEALKP